jgi:hypothetical protein
MKRIVMLVLLVVLGLVGGFYQEKLKISINYILDQTEGIPAFFEATPTQKSEWIEANRFDKPFEYYHNHETVEWLYRLNRNELGALKWTVTLVFSLLFFILNLALLTILNPAVAPLKMLIWCYVGVAVLAFGIYATGVLFSEHVHFYAISRKLMGALQSLVPVMVIWPASRLWEFTQNTHTK